MVPLLQVGHMAYAVRMYFALLYQEATPGKYKSAQFYFWKTVLVRAAFVTRDVFCLLCCFRYYGIVQLIPLFLYSAVYAATPEIRTLATDTVVQKECISYVARQGDPALVSHQVGGAQGELERAGTVWSAMSLSALQPVHVNCDKNGVRPCQQLWGQCGAPRK